MASVLFSINFSIVGHLGLAYLEGILSFHKGFPPQKPQVPSSEVLHAPAFAYYYCMAMLL